MAAKKKSPGFEFIITALKKNRKANYQDISAAAAQKKLKVFPVMFGRAQMILGIVKAAKRGTGKVAKAKAQKARVAAGKRGPGRPRKNAAAASVDSTLSGIIAAVKSTEQEKARYRAVLQRIKAIVDGVLG